MARSWPTRPAGFASSRPPVRRSTTSRREDVRMERLVEAPTRRVRVEGTAAYVRYLGPTGVAIDNVAWSYPDPSPGYEAIRGHLAFYAGPRRRGVGRRRAGDAAARRLLRRLGDLEVVGRSRASRARSAGRRESAAVAVPHGTIFRTNERRTDAQNARRSTVLGDGPRGDSSLIRSWCPHLDRGRRPGAARLSPAVARPGC